MRDHHYICGERYESISDHRNYEYNLSSCEIKDWKDGLIAQLLEHCTGIAEVMASNLVQAWIFFQALISQLLKLCA